MSLERTDVYACPLMDAEWLRIFEAKALAEALTDAGHSVSERTAQRWKKGETSPKPQDVRAIRTLVGAIAPDTQKQAPPAEADGAVPGWALELTNQLRDEIRVNRETIVAALAREVTRRTLEGNEPLLRQLHDVLARVERRLEE